MSETKTINPESITPAVNETPYRLASIYRVLFARIFDLVLSSIPGIILRALVTIYPGQWGLMIGILFSSLGFILLYFVVVPFLLKGNTLGKLIFGIRLKKKGQIKVGFWSLLAREAYFMLIPWAVSIIFQVIAISIMSPYVNSDQTGWAPATKTAILLTQMAYVFYAIWLIFIGVTIKVQAKHQALIDLKLHLYVVEKDPLNPDLAKIKSSPIVLSRDDDHVSLVDQPGNFTGLQIEEIDSATNNEEKEAPNE